MSFCKNCGTEIKEGGKFCPNCGTKVGETLTAATPVEATPVTAVPVEETPVTENVTTSEENQAPKVSYVAPEEPVSNVYAAPADNAANVYATPAQAATYTASQPTTPEKPKKKVNVKLIVIIAAIVVVLAAAAIVVVNVLKNRKKTVNVSEFLDVTYSGVNGSATAEEDCDEDGIWEAIYKACGKKYSEEDALALAISGLSGKTSNLYNLLDSIYIEVNPESGLSNGDEITVTFKYDSKYADANKIKFTGCTKTFTVEGLSDAEQINPFDYLEVSFYGNNGEGSIYIDEDFSSYVWDYYEVGYDANDGALSNGDEVEVKIVESYNSEENPYVLSEDTMTFTVVGLDEVFTYDSLTADMLDELKLCATENFEDDAYDWYDDFTYDDIEYLGYYYNDDDYDNYIVLVFSATATCVDAEAGLGFKTVYFAQKFIDLEISDNAFNYYDYSFADSFYVTGENDEEYICAGFETGHDLYDEYVSYDDENGTIITSKKLPDFSEEDVEEETSDEEETDEEETVEEDETSEEETSEEE